jgi:hypothetical protein
MATLRRTHPADASTHPEQVPLRPTHLVGRHASCELALPDPQVSGHHARIRYVGGSWELRDLNSRNGTTVDGRRLEPNEVVRLEVGQTLVFGTSTQAWLVEETSPPGIVAQHLDGGPALGAADLLALPDDDAPVVTIFRDPGGHWVAEREGAVERVTDRHIVEIGGARWMLHLPVDDGATQEALDLAPSVGELSLEFRVSADEEHVELTARHGDRAFDLKARAHHYVLLTLARQRLEDAQDPSLPRSSHGWVYQDDLSRMLRLDDNAVYLAVYRARKQLKEAGVAAAAGVVERRAATRQLRLGVQEITIRTI